MFENEELYHVQYLILDRYLYFWPYYAISLNFITWNNCQNTTLYTKLLECYEKTDKRYMHLYNTTLI